MRRPLITVLAIAGLLVAAALIATQLRVGPTAALANAPISTLAVGKDSALQAPPSSTTASVASAISESKPAPYIADPAFQKWLSVEAKKMDQPSVDTETTKRAMTKVVSELTPAQSRQLLDTALRPESAAGEKILATYLLVQAGPRALNELQALVTSPLKNAGPQAPHTLGEMESVREKTLRIMALDGLSSRAQSDPAARLALAKAIDEIQDPYIKSYAQERYRRLPPQ